MFFNYFKLVAFSTLFSIVSGNIHAQLPKFAPTNGIIAYYPLDGHAYDLSGNSLHGLIQGPVPVPDSDNNIVGAFYFDGINDFILLGNSSALNPDSGITIIARFMVDPASSASRLKTIIGRNGDNTSSYCYALLVEDNPGNPFIFEWVPALPTSSLSDQRHQRDSFTIESGIWYTVAATYSATNGVQSAYIDGVLVATDSFNTWKLSAVNTPTYIGSFRSSQVSNNHHPFKGAIDYVYLYDRALTNQEIADFFYYSRIDSCVCIQYDTIAVEDTLNIKIHLNTIPNPIVHELKLYPNPGNSNLNIDVGDYLKLNGYRLEIIDMLGRVTYTSSISQKVHSVNITTWTKGLYTFNLIDNSESLVTSKKIVVY